MSLQYSPKIITDSLVMCLDASNNKSYPAADLPIKDRLNLWLDAADDTTFSYSSGTTVSQWRDKSGQNNHAPVIGGSPVRSVAINSRKSVSFTATTSFRCLTGNFSSTATHFVVCRATSSGASYQRVYNGGSDSRIFIGALVNNIATFWGNVSSGWIDVNANSPSTTILNTLRIISAINNGSTGTPYYDGNAMSTKTTTNSGAYVGYELNSYSGGNTAQALVGEVCEIIVFNKQLSATEMKQVHTYLAQKWGVANTDRTIADLSGFDDNGLLGNGSTNNMPLFDSYNKGAFKFFASNKYIKLGNNTNINQFTGDFTVSLWAMATAENSNYGNLIGDYYTAGVATTNEWQIMMNNSSTALNVYRHGTGYVINNTASGFLANTWINVVLTRVGSTVTLYANNAVIGTASNSSVFGSATGSVNIGIDGNNVAEPFSGLISNVLIYQKGLSAVEVAQNYEAQKSKFANTIVQQGLVLNLDAGNPYSYAGAGSAWYDVSGNNLIFNSQGTTQTPFTTIGGSPCFDFNGSGYWECGTNFNLVDLGGDCTIIIWFYCETTAVRTTIFEKAGTSYQSYEQEIAVTWETANDFSYYSRFNPSYDYASTAASTVNAWNMVGIKMSTGKTTAARTGFYSKNGSAWQSNYTSRSNVALVAAGAIRVGSGYAGTITNGYISSVLCYNRMLTDAEILQNYNATKGRFGL
jgi:hypothetical protein